MKIPFAGNAEPDVVVVEIVLSCFFIFAAAAYVSLYVAALFQ